MAKAKKISLKRNLATLRNLVTVCVPNDDQQTYAIETLTKLVSYIERRHEAGHSALAHKFIPNEPAVRGIKHFLSAFPAHSCRHAFRKPVQNFTFRIEP